MSSNTTGRTKKVANNQNNFLSEEAKAITLTALRSIAKQYRLNATDCHLKMRDAGETLATVKPELLKTIGAQFAVSSKSLGKFLEGSAPEREAIYNAIHLWLNFEFKREFQSAMIQHLTQSTTHSIFALLELFGESREINIETIERMRGCYKLYRPSHLNPDNDVSVAKITLGTIIDRDDSNMCSGSYSSNYIEHGRPASTYAEGHFVTDGKSGAALFKTATKKPLLLMIDEIIDSTSSPKVAGFGGIILAGVTSEISAWPFWAEHEDDSNFEPHTEPFEKAGIQNSFALSRLERGSIRWEPKNYLGWPNKGNR
jgi:hypothetical protein